MGSPLRVSQYRTYPVPVDHAFSTTLAFPLEQLFSKRFGPIPPISSVDQDGEWSTVGQVRIIHTSDGGTMREQLVTVESPRVFAYELTEVTGPMKPLVDRVEGEWAFTSVGTGSGIRWSWTVYAKGALGRAAMPVFGRLWHGYARRSLDRLEAFLLAAV